MKKKVIPAIIIIALIFIIGGVYGLQLYREHYSYSSEKADLNSYFDITSDNDVAIILGNERIEERARLFDGYYYMDFSSVQKYLNSRFYYGTEDNTLLYTTPNRIITAEIGSSSWTDTQGGSGDEAYQIARIEGETLYVALEYVKKYTNFDYQGFTEPNHMQLTTDFGEQTFATIKKDTDLRLRGGVKSEVLESLKKGDKVVILEQLENWSKVKTSDSFIGYVENKRLTDITTMSLVPAEGADIEEYTSIKRDHTMNVGFHMIGGAGGNDTLLDVISGTKSLNVVAPTWLSVSDNDGNLRSFCSSSYVKTAHDKGLEVWAVLDNFNASKEISTTEVLSHASTRANMIKQAVDEALSCGADGINLDFELVATEAGQSFIEFVRELSIACRANGLVFSVDNYVPMNFNNHYNIKEQGVVADYVIIMGYDEHYAGSDEAGSVASLGYVENGIINTVEDVDPSKVINAVPFYTRIWETKPDGTVSSQAVSMPDAAAYVQNHGISLTWDAEAGQYYGEYTKDDGTLVQIWLEDAESIQQKITSMQLHGIAGIAEWRLGMETSDIWDVIAAYVEG